MQQPPMPVHEQLGAPGPSMGGAVSEPAGFVVGWTPVTMANRVAMLGSALRSMVLRMVLWALLWTGVWWFFLREQGAERWGSLWWLVAGYGFSITMICWVVVQIVLARRALGRIPTGEAVRVTPHGVVLHSLAGERLQMDWGQVACFRIEGHEFGSGPRLRVKVPVAGKKRPQTVWEVPLYYVDALPGTIDGALRAFSRGRHDLDVRGMDTFW